MMEDNLSCPHCDSTNFKLNGKRFSEIGNRELIAYKYVCKSCGKNWSVRVGSALLDRAEELGINPKLITQVKHWQTASGDPRISITEKAALEDNLGIIEAFEELTKQAPRVLLPSIKMQEESGADFLLLTTDRHYGMEVGNEALYAKPYGETEIDDQNLHMIDSVVSEARMRGKFKHFWYVDLGDTVHGYNNKTVRGHHELKSSLNNRQQFDLYVSNVWALISTLYAYGIADHYHILFLVNDNHAGDFGYICARAVELLAQVHTPEVEFTIETRFITHRDIGGASYIFTHGKDREYMKFNMPVVLNPKTEVLLDKYMMHHNLPAGKTHVMKGDIHQPATSYGRSFRYKNVIPSTGHSEREDILYGTGWRGYEYEVIKEGKILQERTVIL